MTGTEEGKLGLWLIGARGAISTCLVYGLSGLREGWIEPVGLVSERDPLRGLPLPGFGSFVLGGHEVSRGDLTRGAGELVRQGVLPAELVAAASADAAAFEARVRPGVLDLAEVGRAELDPDAARLGSAGARDKVERLVADLDAFRSDNGIGRLVVCNLASTEAWQEERPSWASLGAFEEALDRDQEIPASCLYAYAALRAGAAHVNFTPSRGAAIPALRELALERGLPHCGNDGKTGETLVKSALAPMFAARALKVLSWQGYNMLGNADGRALSDPSRRLTKERSKDEVVRSILGDPSVHTRVGIDYVPSLADHKTAWDYVHFEGFLGARMSMQFTWSGSDSALAAPLVVDLARLAAFALAQGERGAMEHTAFFFKAPLGGGSHDLSVQFAALAAYAERHLRGS